MVPTKVVVPSERLALARKLSGWHDRFMDIEAPEKRRHEVENKWLSCQKQISKAYIKRLRP